MNEQALSSPPTDPTTVFCSRCGKPMLIAPQHLYTAVSCPHCSTTLEPWRIQAGSHEAATMPYPPANLRSGGQSPPRHPGHLQHAGPMQVYSWRNRWIAGALAILLGVFGVHRFYLGFTGIGIIQIIVTICTLGVVTSVWAFIEGILCFCGAMRDVDGLPLSG